MENKKKFRFNQLNDKAKKVAAKNKQLQNKLHSKRPKTYSLKKCYDFCVDLEEETFYNQEGIVI